MDHKKIQLMGWVYGYGMVTVIHPRWNDTGWSLEGGIALILNTGFGYTACYNDQVPSLKLHPLPANNLGHMCQSVNMHCSSAQGVSCVLSCVSVNEYIHT